MIPVTKCAEKNRKYNVLPAPNTLDGFSNDAREKLQAKTYYSNS
jgi:hypothetical protein